MLHDAFHLLQMHARQAKTVQLGTYSINQMPPTHLAFSRTRPFALHVVYAAASGHTRCSCLATSQNLKQAKAGLGSSKEATSGKVLQLPAQASACAKSQHVAKQLQLTYWPQHHTLVSIEGNLCCLQWRLVSGVAHCNKF